MTLAHLSDTHLGFSQYGRSTEKGLNQRLVDVMQTFDACLAAIEERDPDLVIHSGDFFHMVRPGNNVIVRAFAQLMAFQERRKFRPFILIAGNHDTPRTADSGNILNLFSKIRGVHVEVGGLKSLTLPELDLEVMCVPNQSLAGQERYDYVPTSSHQNRVLVLHGLASGIKPDTSEFNEEEIRPDRWSYIALGDFHIHKVYGPNACYAGSTDFTSTNIWEEIGSPKGWVWFDTKVDRLEHVPVWTRPVIDLPVIDADGMDIATLEAKIQAQATWKPETDPIVRQRIRNLPILMRGQIGSAVLREIRATALNYDLVTYPPASAPRDTSERSSEGEDATAQTLENEWDQYLTRADVPTAVDRTALRDLGNQLLREAAERETTPA